MKWNNGLQRKRFNERWKTLHIIYKELGMPEEAIQEMYEHDWNTFKKERVFHIHNQYIPDCEFDYGGRVDEGMSPLMKKHFAAFTVKDEYFKDRKYGWIEELDNRRLSQFLQSLSKDKLEVLTKYVFEEKTQGEIAKELGISQVAVSKKLSRIKNNFKKIK